MSPGHGIPPAGPGHYLRDAVIGAGDGVITTFAIITGTTGAALGPRVAIILGLANLVADGISMGAGNYLALKSELEQAGRSVRDERPRRHGAVTFAAFVVAGGVPLLAFLAPAAIVFPLAVALAAATLFAVGALRTSFVGRGWARCGIEMLLVGGLAGAAAYAVGALAQIVI